MRAHPPKTQSHLTQSVQKECFSVQDCKEWRCFNHLQFTILWKVLRDSSEISVHIHQYTYIQAKFSGKDSENVFWSYESLSQMGSHAKDERHYYWTITMLKVQTPASSYVWGCINALCLGDQQDNARPDSVHTTTEWLHRHRVCMLEGPVCSPYLSPTGNEWQITKWRCRQQWPQTVDQLKFCIQGQ